MNKLLFLVALIPLLMLAPMEALAQNATITNTTQHCLIPGSNPPRYNTSCITFTPQEFDKLISGFQHALNGTLPDEK